MSFFSVATQPTQKPKDRIVWVAPYETRPGPLDLNGFECPKCLEYISAILWNKDEILLLKEKKLKSSKLFKLN
jgi:hypothetical protein